jgi:CheY-like chemotaxis protein
MVYGIFKRHRATVEIQSRIGVGTTFAFHFKAPTEVVHFAAGESNREHRPLQILVVDDQELLRGILTQHLEQDMHSVETATDGIEALEKIRAGSYDLVITDQAMPRMTGSQLVTAIKDEWPDLKVVMLTGFGSHEHQNEDQGADAYLAKPISREALRRALALVMDSAAHRGNDHASSLPMLKVG